ncbi:hypothetical protein ACH5RR_008359 [Cinchona calisaya]|uniref:Stress up-regulated Nod 19 n=1 Tax=Cinchona calisaya TaxID=153742 RepID=A0ABD3AEY7_9GENT
MSKSCMVIFLATLLLVEIVQSSPTLENIENGMMELKTAVLLSPKFELEPGSVINKYYYNIDFPRGHIALKEFDAEVVDRAGNSVPLHETYLHHWMVKNYYQFRGINNISKYHRNIGFRKSDQIPAGNDGVCDHGLSQIFGLGSRTRKMSTKVPDPYGIEFGNAAKIPVGYEERWLLNLHAIDTQGAEDQLGCTECRCNLYNVTIDEYGKNLDPNYIGGFKCCYDETRCRVKEDGKGLMESVQDMIVFVSIILPTGGNVIYGVAHQHIGGIGAALYGEDGRVICSSVPIYGERKEPGNEAGYIVGMSTCYPQPDSLKILDGETLTVSSYYSSEQGHTRVMGLFYILVADSDSSVKLNSS